jgi:hypothetical protein
VQLPGLLTAVILHPPVLGATLTSHDASAALAIRGVRQIIELPVPKQPCKFQPLGGLAVIAENTWAALRGRKALVATWSHGDNAIYESASYRKQQAATIRGAGAVVRSRGHAEDALASATSRLEADYFMPHLSHAPMEPPVATANVKDGKCEVWTCTQNPQECQVVVAELTGIAPTNVTVNVTLLGGGFGRKSKPDYVGEAAFLSQQLGAPVHVQWTREDDIRHDYFHTTSAQSFIDIRQLVHHRLEARAHLLPKLVERAHVLGQLANPLHRFVAVGHDRGELGVDVGQAAFQAVQEGFELFRQTREKTLARMPRRPKKAAGPRDESCLRTLKRRVLVPMWSKRRRSRAPSTRCRSFRFRARCCSPIRCCPCTSSSRVIARW